MLQIPAALAEQMVRHARADHPVEACGILAGPAGSDRPERFVPLVNAARSATRYEVGSADLLRLYRDLDERHEGPVVVYHSHPSTPAYPSPTDIALASEPAAHYVIVSTRRSGPREGPYELRSFRIVEGVVTEEDVVVLPDPAQPGRADPDQEVP